jgi:hypothetical protein
VAGRGAARGVYDNLRSVVARREGDAVVWNRRFLHLRGHYGFHAHPCTPATPREKGAVEAAVRYLKSGFWPSRRFKTLSELDARYAYWRDHLCNRRRHARWRWLRISRQSRHSTHGSDEAFGDRVRFGRADRRPDDLDANLHARRVLRPLGPAIESSSSGTGVWARHGIR